jgi:flagellar biogenesis protein FliO
MGWVLLKTLFSLVAVIGLMFGTVLLLRKFFVGNNSKLLQMPDIEIIGRRVIQPKNSVLVLKIYNKVLIVGISEKGMHPLSEITDQTTINEIEQRIGRAQTGPRWPFKNQTTKSDLFSKYLSNIWNRNDPHGKDFNIESNKS